MIEKIHLKNFKCFNDINIETSKLNVFAGINSMGKSSIIQSLLLLRQAYETNSIKNGIQLNGSLVNIGRGYDVLNRSSEDEKITVTISFPAVLPNEI